MVLTPRLEAIAQQVTIGCRFADIGTDHAYLPVELLLRGVLDHAIAADLRTGPLERAKQTALQFGVENRISFRLCDGLTGIAQEEVDTIAIAGMGGDTIAAILAAAPWTYQNKKQLILQPMSKSYSLRNWLQIHGYQILQEQIVREGKRLYSIWNVKAGNVCPQTLGELWAGKQSEDPLRVPYLESRISKAEKALLGQVSASQKDETAIAFLQQVLSELYTMKSANKKSIGR